MAVSVIKLNPFYRRTRQAACVNKFDCASLELLGIKRIRKYSVTIISFGIVSGYDSIDRNISPRYDYELSFPDGQHSSSLRGEAKIYVNLRWKP